MDGGSWHCIGDREQDHHHGKEMQKSKTAVWGNLKRPMKIREVKSIGEKERYSHLKAEFQRIARKDKKGFLSEQCKEIEDNNWMGKTRGLFKQIRDTKETFYAITIKDRNSKDWTEEKILRIGDKYTQKNYTKDILMAQITMTVWLLTLSQTSWSVKSRGP